MEVWRKQRQWNRTNHPLTYLFWEATIRCNFKCKHCGSAYEKLSGNPELSTQEIIKAFQDISKDFDAKNIMVAITGGEPLLRTDLPEIGKALTDLGFNWGLVTNGYLLDRKLAQKLKAAGMKTVVVSIDDVGSKHDVFRGMPGAYDHALQAIKNLAEVGNLYDIQITTTVNKQTINSLDGMLEAFLPLPITSWRTMGIAPIGRAADHPELILEKADVLYLLNFIKSKNTSRKIPFKIIYGCENYLGENYETKVRPYYFECKAGINVASILYNGDIFVCPNVPRNTKLIQGNVKTDNFYAIWENRFEYFRNPNKYAPRQCRDCEEWRYCEGGSRHLGENPCFMKMK